jgi:hypothetical protein
MSWCRDEYDHGVVHGFLQLWCGDSIYNLAWCRALTIMVCCMRLDNRDLVEGCYHHGAGHVHNCKQKILVRCGLSTIVMLCVGVYTSWCGAWVHIIMVWFKGVNTIMEWCGGAYSHGVVQGYIRSRCGP